MIDAEPAILAAAKAIGLLDGTGNLSASWFENPLGGVESILTSPDQRTAILDLFDQLFPPVIPPGAPNEKWHPLLANQPNGNLFVTVANGAGPLTLGIAGEIHSTSSPLAASLQCQLPLVSAAGSSVTAVAGTAGAPLQIDLRVELNWSRAGGQSIDLSAIRASARLTPLAASPVALHVTCEGLSLDGSPPKDQELDPTNLGSEALPLIVALVREELRQLAGATGEAAAVAQHLMPVLGLAGEFPPFPFATVASDPAGFRSWLAAIASAGKLADWLGHLGALFGGAAVTQGSGTAADPWRALIFQIDVNSELDITLSQAKVEHTGTPEIAIGLLGIYRPGGAGSPARIQAAATLASIPLQGLDSPAVLPFAAITVAAPGDPAQSLVSSDNISVHSIAAGAQWNGSSIIPLLELDTVALTFQGNKLQYDRIDLTHADSTAATDLVLKAIQLFFGNTGTAQHLLALAGLTNPAADPSWTHQVDLQALVTNPARAIAAVHRAALLDPIHSWAFLFGELASLLGIADPVAGTGTLEDPWRVPLESGAASIELAAWNSPQTTNPGDPQPLRIGLRFSSTLAPWNAWWLAELLAIDLPATGAATVALMGGQRAEILLQPVPVVPEVARISMSADSIALKLDWSPGSAFQIRAVVSNLSVTSGTTVTIASLVFPPPGGFDFSNPTATLGIDAYALQRLFRALLSRGAYSWAGVEGLILGSFLGLNGNLPGLQTDWPLLSSNFLADPLGALRGWLGSLVTSVSADGSPFLPQALAWLQAFVNHSRRELDLPVPDIVSGSGFYDDPWALAVLGDAELLAWLEPAGPPPTWAVPIAPLMGTQLAYEELVAWARSFGGLLPTAQEALSRQDTVGLVGGLNALEAWFATTDGFVPAESQIPTGGTWTAGTAIQSAHTRQPADPAAIAQINAQIAAWNPGAKAVLLIGPAFLDHTAWNDLLSPVTVKPNFNLRLSGVDPASVDLRGVTEAADFYSADLAENGLEGVTAQIARVVARIGELRPGVPVTLVAHSTAGLAARAFAAANPSTLRGLITLGCPHLGSPLLPLQDPAAGTAVRTIAEITPVLPAGAIKDALDAIVAVMDGLVAAPAGQLPAAEAFSADAFAAPATTDTGGVPALAIGGALNVSLFDQVKQALADLGTASAAASRPAPTHLAFGARVRLDFGADGEVATEVSIRCDAARLALQPAAPAPPRAERSVLVQIAFSRPGDWIAGSAASNVRVRWAELGLQIASASLQPSIRLHGAAFQSPALGLIDESHPQALAALGAVFHSFADLGAAAGPSLSSVLGALTSLGITTSDPHGGMGLSADAWKALTTDPRGYLAPRLASALAAGLGGFSAGAGSSFTVGIGGTPFQVYVDSGSIGIRTTSAVAFSDLAGIEIDGHVSVPSFAPSLDLTFQAGAMSLAYTQASGQLQLSASPWIDPITLLPAPNASAIQSALNHAIPRLLLSGAASALIEAALGPGVSVGPLTALFENPGAALVSGSALGDGKCLNADRINAFLGAIAGAVGLPEGAGFPLPADLQIIASGADPVVIALSTASPIGGVLDLQLGASIDCSRHVTPEGAATLNLSLPGAWGSLQVAFSVDTAGVSLVLAPQTTPATPPIQLLPTFGGLGALLGAAEALLPAALDALVDAIGPSALLNDTLALAQAFDLYDSTLKFTGHAAQLRALLQGNWANSVSAAMQTTAIPALRNVLAHFAGTVNVSSNTVTIGVGSQFHVALGWDSGPALSLHTSALKTANGALTADIDLGFVGGQLTTDVALGLNLASSIGVSVVPALQIAYTGAGFSVKLLPLGTAGESTLAINVAPSPGIQTGGDIAGALAREWLLPVAADLVVAAAKPHLGLSVWSGGPTLQKLLQASGLTTPAGDLAAPLPAIDVLVRNLLTAFSAEAEIDAAGLKIRFVSDATGLGVNLRGSHDFLAGSLDLTLRLENTNLPTASPGVTLYVFRNPANLQFSPRLSVAGLGIELAGQEGGPLVNNSGFRLGRAGASLFFDFDGSLTNLGGAVDAQDLGIPLGGLLGGPNDGGNPVASSLLEGAHGDGGDPNPVNPGIDLQVSYINGAFSIQLGAPQPPLWIGVHRSFGPIYIEQIGLEWTSDAADLLVDGAVHVAALTVQAYELDLKIPFKQLLAPEHWSLDLAGLAVGFQSGPVSISGGLLKNPGPPIEYDGMLSADIAGRGFTVVGSYARPVDNLGNYTSLFVFVSLPIPLGGPPFLFVTGLGGGAAYNRELTPPTDFNQIPSFFLVAAIDDSSLANNPMGALTSIGQFAPPLRGGYWLAAGVRFNSFVVVNSVAVVYVALNRGFEVGVLGVSRLQLPAAGEELVNIELALKARFSSAEQVLSIQAQLTDHSWLFSPDCQLTGGFAFFIWFAQGHFVLTIGGYHPAFQKPPQFPDVPRLGFRWQVFDNVQIKGEAYFALTSSAFMCGGRLEAAAGLGGISAWFTAHLDILIQWDPFHYDFLGGIEVGVSLTIEVCFFGACADVSISISRGADIHVFGPPFHVDVTFDAYISTITLSFGGDPQPVPDALPWPAFRDKYLISGNPENTWVSARAIKGLLPSEPPGAQPSPGTQAGPWKLNPEFSFLTESRMPVSGYAVTATALDSTGAAVPVTLQAKPDSRSFDIAPMQALGVGSAHIVTFTPTVTHPGQFVVEEIFDLVPEATWRWYDPAHLPAAANRINAIIGLRITGVAVLQGKSALIPIATLVDDDPRFARPLPFASVPVSTGALQSAGVAAEALAALTAAAGNDRSLSAAATVLAGAGFFANARAGAGLPPAGIPPLAARALQRDRSSPPLLTPLSTGLSMKPVGLAAPPPFFRPGAISPVFLDQPRLRAVLQAPALPAVDAPAVVRTTVTQTPLANVPRMAAPQLKVVPGAKLHTVVAPSAAAPTSVSAAPRTLRNPDLAALSGRAHTANFEAAAQSLAGDGITVPAGTTHIWELARKTDFAISGNAIARIVYLDRAGNPLQDIETIPASGFTSTSVAGAAMVAITCLGTAPANVKASSGFGAVTSLVAPPKGVPVTGWQTGNVFPQVGPSAILARGSILLLRRGNLAVLNNQKTTQAMMPLSAALAQQSGSETWLPLSTGVVMIILDQQDPTAASSGDLAIACQGATLALPPVLGAGGSRRALLYDVTSTDPKSGRITISVGSKAGWSLAGVVGLPGRAAEWAGQLHGSVPPHFVPGGPVTSSGELRVRASANPGGNS